MKLGTLFFLFAGILGCTEKSSDGKITSIKSIDEPSNYDRTLTPLDTFRITLDSITSPVFHCVGVYTDPTTGTDYLSFQNYKGKHINFYNLNTTMLEFKIEYELEGPDGIGRLDGYYIHNLDSIFTISRFQYSVFITDSTGRVVDRFKVLRGNSIGQTVLPKLSNVSPMVLIGDSLYVAGRSDNYMTRSKDQTYYNFIALNLTNRGYRYIEKYPQEFHDEFWGLVHYDFSFTSNNLDSFIISYAILDELVVRPLKGKSERVYAGSKDIDEIEPMAYNEDFTILTNYAFDQPIYVGVLYDKYRDVYYRIAQQPLQEERRADALRLNMIRDESIVILDSNFRKRGEFTLPLGLESFEAFITREGIVIPHKTKENEDEKFFTIFSLDEIAQNH